MHHNEAISRSDRVLIFTLAIILATASAALGAAMTHPSVSFRHPVAVEKPYVIKAPRAIPDVATDALLAEHRCLTEALYYEARSEGRGGQQAVAEVVFHRLNTGNYGNSICAVVYEGASHPGCQFSFACDGSVLHLRETPAWKEAEQLAEQILTGKVKLRNVTSGATNYHAVSVNPYWAPTLRKTTQIGNHIFYRGSPASAAAQRGLAKS
jgi:spore germination cell wall hydrolase CwlJ-like protein